MRIARIVSPLALVLALLWIVVALAVSAAGPR
jgi:hypothetical protein